MSEIFCLTNEHAGRYGESLKTVTPAFTPRQSVFFMPMARMRAENNQYQPSLCYNFSESAPLSFLTAISKMVTQMISAINTTTQSTLQQLYGFYQSMRNNWYEGKYNLEQENAYLAVYSALEEALLKLPIQTEADRKVKLQYLKNVIGVSIEDANFKYDFSAGYGCEEEAFAIIDQLTGE